MSWQNAFLDAEGCARDLAWTGQAGTHPHRWAAVIEQFVAKTAWVVFGAPGWGVRLVLRHHPVA